MDTRLDPLLRNRSAEDAGAIRRAFEFADRAHRGQLRYSGEPYITHPIAVATILNDLHLDVDTIVAGLLHDTIEDTAVTEDDIRSQFGEKVLFLVKAVTRIKSIETKDTRETSYRTLMRMFFAMADDIRVIIIKLADRLHNLRTLQFQPPKKQKEIALQSIQIYAPIAERLNMGELKGQIEDLAFPYAYPEKYRELIEATHDYFQEQKAYMEAIRPKIIANLSANGILDFQIDCRVKHYYSLYQKLQRRNQNLNAIYDLVAFRIIVNDIADCYRALGILHQKYRPLPKLIKDYIALPKPNGYRSLHTTAFCEDGHLVEFQIRTHEMHTQAENGVAAHWAFAESGKRPGVIAQAQELAWVNKMREWRQFIDNPKEFFDALKLDMFAHRIFVFTPKGDVKDLPEGATLIDFAYTIHSDIGDHCVGAHVNGRMAPLKYKLQNGDVCSIATAKHQKPTSDWLIYAKTPEARRRIKSILKIQRS